MKKASFHILTAVLMVAVIAVPALADARYKPTPTPDPGYCGNPPGPYGLDAYVSSSVFDKGQAVDFCMLDNARIPLFIGSKEHPWEVIGPKGEVVYRPASVPPTSQPPISWSFYDSWDQTDQNGEQVRPGDYTIRFVDQIYTSPQVKFRIR